MSSKQHTPLTRTAKDLIPRAREGAPQQGAQVTRRIPVAGAMRSFVLYVPRGCMASHPLPLVLNLHGSTSYPEEQMHLSQMPSSADQQQALVLAPEALERSWNADHRPDREDDVRFIALAIEEASKLWPTDLSKLCATGFSGGGRMLSLLATHLPFALRAVAPVSGLRAPYLTSRTLQKHKPTLLLSVHGALDQVNPAAGSGAEYWQESVEAAFGAWIDYLGLRGATKIISHPNEHVQRTAYSTGTTHAELSMVNDLGHIWPGFPHRLGPPLDPPSRALSATPHIMSAFAAHVFGSPPASSEPATAPPTSPRER